MSGQEHLRLSLILAHYIQQSAGGTDSEQLEEKTVLMRWMRLEPMIQSEVSQKDKDHYSILMHIYGI